MTAPTQAQHRRMHVLWRLAGITTRTDRLALTSRALGRTIHSSTEMTQEEAAQLIHYMQGLDGRGALYDSAQGWLAAHQAAVRAVAS